MAKCCETHEGTKPPSCSAETPRAIFEAGESKTLHFSISWSLTRTLWATPSALHLQHSHKASILRFTPLNPQVQISKKSGRFFVSLPQDSICFKPQGSHLNTALNTITATWFAAWMDIIPAIYPGKYSRISWDVSCPGTAALPSPQKYSWACICPQKCTKPTASIPIWGCRRHNTQSHTGLSSF